MASNRVRRITKELTDIHEDISSNIHCEALNDDISHLRATFQGPPDTAYEGGTFVIDVQIPDGYPFRPPVMKFQTKLWHPNVSSQTVSKTGVTCEYLLIRDLCRELSASTPSAQLGRPY